MRYAEKKCSGYAVGMQWIFSEYAVGIHAVHMQGMHGTCLRGDAEAMRLLGLLGDEELRRGVEQHQADRCVSGLLWALVVGEGGGAAFGWLRQDEPPRVT